MSNLTRNIKISNGQGFFQHPFQYLHQLCKRSAREIDIRYKGNNTRNLVYQPQDEPKQDGSNLILEA